MRKKKDPRAVFKEIFHPPCFGRFYGCFKAIPCDHSKECSEQALKNNLEIVGKKLGLSDEEIERKWKRYQKYLEEGREFGEE